MPSAMPLKPVGVDRLREVRDLPKMREFSTKYPRRAGASVAAHRKALRAWQQRQPRPVAPKNPQVRVAAVEPTAKQLARLRAVVRSEAGPSALVEQRLNAAGLFGTVYSALASYEFMKLHAEYRRRSGRGGASPATARQWSEIVRAGQAAFQAAGVRGVTEAKLLRYERELTKSRPTLDAVVTVANSGRDAVAGGALRGSSVISGSFVATVADILDLIEDVTVVPGLCDTPIAQGSFTKHFSRSFSLNVTLTVWCPTWTNPFRTCRKTFTIAGASFSLGLNVGYRVTCCGATAWGQGYAQACGTILGVTVCAGCSATVVGVAGVSRTPVSGGCAYGIGVNATLKCTFAGATVFYASVPFGWTVTGPCPPPGLCP